MTAEIAKDVGHKKSLSIVSAQSSLSKNVEDVDENLVPSNYTTLGNISPTEGTSIKASSPKLSQNLSKNKWALTRFLLNTKHGFKLPVRMNSPWKKRQDDWFENNTKMNVGKKQRSKAYQAKTGKDDDDTNKKFQKIYQQPAARFAFLLHGKGQINLINLDCSLCVIVGYIHRLTSLKKGKLGIFASNGLCNFSKYDDDTRVDELLPAREMLFPCEIETGKEGFVEDINISFCGDQTKYSHIFSKKDFLLKNDFKKKMQYIKISCGVISTWNEYMDQNKKIREQAIAKILSRRVTTIYQRTMTK